MAWAESKAAAGHPKLKKHATLSQIIFVVTTSHYTG
jgi:hypothetical protein